MCVFDTEILLRRDWNEKGNNPLLRYSLFWDLKKNRTNTYWITSQLFPPPISCHNICLRLEVSVKVSPLPALCFPFSRFSRCSFTLQHGAHRGIRARRGEQNDDTHHQLAGEPVPGRCSMNNNKSLILMYGVLGQRRSADTRVRCAGGKHAGITSDSINYFQRALMFY